MIKTILMVVGMVTALGFACGNASANEFCDLLVKNFEYSAQTSTHEVKRSLVDCAQQYSDTRRELLKMRDTVLRISAKDPSDILLLEAIAAIDAKAEKYRKDFLSLVKRIEQMETATTATTPPTKMAKKTPM